MSQGSVLTPFVSIPDVPQRRNLRRAYIGAHFGKSLFWYTTEFLFAFFLAEVYGLRPSAVGLLLFVFLIWDAITDPLLGLLFTRKSIQTRELLSLQFAGAVLSAVSFVALFLKPDLPPDQLFIYSAIVGLLFRSSYTIYDVPQNTLLSRLGTDGDKRLVLSSLRAAFSAIAALTLSGATFFVLGEGDLQRAQPFLVMALLFVLVAIVSAGSLWALAGRLKASQDNPFSTTTGVSLSETLNEPGILRCLAAIFVLSIGWPLFGKLVPFFSVYTLGNSQYSSALFSAIAIGAFASQPLWIAIGRRANRSSLLTGGLAGVVISSSAFVTIGGQSIAGAVIATACLSACTSAIGMTVWTRLADLLTPSRGTKSNDVLAFGALTFASKLALGFGGLALGATLNFVGYVAGQPLSEANQADLVMVMGLMPAACAVLAWLFAGIRFPGSVSGKLV